MDYTSPEHLPVISSWSMESVASAWNGLFSSTTPSSAIYPAANRALYVPFNLRTAYLVKRLWWANGSAVAGNIDCGIYSIGGVRLASAGSTAQSGTNAIQSVTLGTPIFLTPGAYYMAISASSASATFQSAAVTARLLRTAGLTEEATGIPLPATATPTTLSNAYIPLFGFANATVI